ATAQDQFPQQNPYYNNPAPQPGAPPGAPDDNYDDGDDDNQSFAAQTDPGHAPQPPMPQGQPFLPRDGQPFPPRAQQQHRNPQNPPQQQPQPSQASGDAPEVGDLPAFITGGQPQPAAGHNGHEQGERQDRFGRRRRRHRSGSNFRPDANGNVQAAAPAEGGDEPPAQPD
ncbi:MAG: hypothetical protein K9G60_11065, partial [Pseudolabrys sp.]|nr:hypothetical protein [Pseudolabrys sp.]